MINLWQMLLWLPTEKRLVSYVIVVWFADEFILIVSSPNVGIRCCIPCSEKEHSGKRVPVPRVGKRNTKSLRCCSHHRNMSRLFSSKPGKSGATWVYPATPTTVSGLTLVTRNKYYGVTQFNLRLLIYILNIPVGWIRLANIFICPIGRWLIKLTYCIKVIAAILPARCSA